MQTSNKYTPSLEAIKFISFIRASGNESNDSPEVHYKIADSLFSPNRKDWKLLIECTRGLGKSTTVEYAVIYAAAMGEWPGFGKVPFVVFLGASQEGNVKQFFRNVANKIERSKFISSVLKVKRVTDTELELENADGVEMMIVGRGMGTNFRGLRSKSGDRPTLVIADDILSNEVATSDTIRNTIDTNWYNSVLPALDPTKHKIIYIGTPISDKDLLSQLKNSNTYKVERYPLCDTFPCEEKEYQSIWPDRFTYEYTLDMYKQYEAAGKTQGFYQEYLLEVTDLSTLLVEEDDVRWYDPSTVVKNKSGYNFYISTDFATSTKKSADFSTIGVWAISSNNDWLLVDGQCKRQSMQENIEDLFRYVKKWKPISVGIESSGQQGGFLSIIEEMKQQRNIWFQFAKKPGSKEYGIRPVKDKVERFVKGVQPKFKQGKVWIPKPDLIKMSNYSLFTLVDELINELSKFTLAGGVAALKHDDCGTYDVKVDTPTGSKLLGEIRNGDEVISFGTLGSVVSKVKDARITGIKPIVNIELEGGDVLKFSEFHPMLSGNKYKLVRDLQVGDVITRNIKWKQQLNMTDLNGQENLVGITNLQQDVQMVAEKTGIISMCTKKMQEKFQKDTKYITRTKTNKIITLKILNYCQAQNIKLSTKNKIKLMVIDLQTTWQRTLMKFKNLLKKESTELTLERIEEENYQMSQSNARAVEMSSHHITNHAKILSSAATVVEMSGTNNMLKNVNVKNVEEYSNLVLDQLSTVAMTAEVQTLKDQLQESINMYVVCAEQHSKVLQTKLAAEINAQEIERMNLKEYTEKIKRIWVTAPEQTYNFEVESYHNYQVHDGIVVHNCIDLLNQLSEMELFAPSEDVYTEQVMVKDELIWIGSFDDDDGLNEYCGSTVF